MSAPADPPDADEQRRRSRTTWEARATAWEEQREWFQAAAEPVSARMLDAIAPRPGHVVLEAAAGLGDTGLRAAGLVHPGGRVILADGAEAMVAAARRNAERQGIHNVEATPMELEWLDMPAASVDALLVRFGYMLVPDPEGALRDARRVVRPGGRIALAVWDRVEDNPWFAAPMEVLRARGLVADWPPPADVPNAFALADRERVAELLAAAGFLSPEVDRVTLTFRSEDPADHRRRVVALVDRVAAALGALEPAARAEAEAAIDAALAAFPDPDGPRGSVALPGAVLVAAADA